MLGIGLTGIGASLFIAALAPNGVVVPVLGAGSALLAMAGTNSWAAAQTIAGPRVAGRWTGVQNFVGNMGGAGAPVLTGYLLGRTGEFYLPLGIAAVIAWMGTFSWVFVVGRIEEVDWDLETHGSRLPLEQPATSGTRP